MSPQTNEETKTPPTTRTVVVAGGLAAAAVGTLAVFAAGGWLVVGAVAAGTAVTGYTVHRIRNPRTRPGLLSSLLLKPSRPKSTGGKLAWPFTGNQRSRGALSAGSGASARKAVTGGRTGLPKLRGISAGSGAGRKTPGSGTTRTGSGKPGAALRAVTGGTARRGRANPTHARPVPKLSARPKAGKPSGLSRPKTGSSTGSKPRLNAVKRPSGTSHRPTSHRPAGASHRRPKLGSGSLISGGRRLGAASRRTSPGRLGSGKRGALHRAKRLGLPGLGNRPNRAPSRSARRLNPYQRPSARRLIRDGLGLPSRRPKSRSTTPSQRRLSGTRRRLKRPSVPFHRPTPSQRKRARRTLRLRALTRLWSVRKLPGRHWDRMWQRIPQPINPRWLVPTIEPKLKAAPGYRSPEPILVPAIRKETPKVTAPLEAASDAFAQLANFTPETPEQMEMLLTDLSEMLARFSGSMTTLADRLGSELPIAQAVGDTLRDLGAGVLSMQGAAQQASQTLRQEHEADFTRRENPRPNEQWWLDR